MWNAVIQQILLLDTWRGAGGAHTLFLVCKVLLFNLSQEDDCIMIFLLVQDDYVLIEINDQKQKEFLVQRL